MNRNDASRVINVIDGRISRKTQSSAGIEYTYGRVVANSGAYASVCLYGETDAAYASAYFALPNGLYPGDGDIVRVGMDKARGTRFIDQVFPATKYPKIAWDLVGGELLKGSGASAPTELIITDFARTLLDDTDVATVRATLGLGTMALLAASSYQPISSDLSAIAALTSAADQVPYATGSHAWNLLTITSTARSLLDDTSVAAMRATLGLDAAWAVAAIAGQTIAPTGFSNIPIDSFASGGALTITGDVANLNPTVGRIVRLIGDGAAHTIHGMVAGAVGERRLISNWLGGSGGTLTFPYNSSGASTGNKWAGNGGVDVVLAYQESRFVVYAGASVWEWEGLQSFSGGTPAYAQAKLTGNVAVPANTPLAGYSSHELFVVPSRAGLWELEAQVLFASAGSCNAYMCLYDFTTATVYAAAQDDFTTAMARTMSCRTIVDLPAGRTVGVYFYATVNGTLLQNTGVGWTDASWMIAKRVG